jgi:hypothetical protein
VWHISSKLNTCKPDGCVGVLLYVALGTLSLAWNFALADAQNQLFEWSSKSN